MPGRHINDHQMRLYMKSRLTLTKAAAGQAAMSLMSAYRIENDPRLPSQKALPRGRRRPDPLVDIFDPEVVPMLQAPPGLRPIGIFEECSGDIRSCRTAYAGPWSGGSASGAP